MLLSAALPIALAIALAYTAPTSMLQYDRVVGLSHTQHPRPRSTCAQCLPTRHAARPRQSASTTTPQRRAAHVRCWCCMPAIFTGPSVATTVTCTNLNKTQCHALYGLCYYDVRRSVCGSGMCPLDAHVLLLTVCMQRSYPAAALAQTTLQVQARSITALATTGHRQRPLRPTGSMPLLKHRQQRTPLHRRL